MRQLHKGGLSNQYYAFSTAGSWPCIQGESLLLFSKISNATKLRFVAKAKNLLKLDFSKSTALLNRKADKKHADNRELLYIQIVLSFDL